MKKILACALILVMCLGSLAACGNNDAAEPTPTTAPTAAPTQAPAVDTVSDLVNAKNYLFTMYKDQTEATPVDYTVVGVVNIGGTLFPIEWTVDNDSVKIIPGDNKMVTIDIDDKNPEEVTYVLTATLKDDKGNTESCSFTHRVPAAIILDEGMSYADIVDAAYTLEDGLAMDGTFTLYGTVTKIDTPWSEDYQNITVTIAVAGKEDKPIMCYRLKGEGAKDLAVGDAITVEGTLKNYKGTIEFDAGCVLVGYGEQKDYTALLDAAYTLEDGLSMSEPCTMSGVIHNIDTVWSEDYQNITVSMTVNGVADKPIMCYRLKGEGAKELAVGDYITVTGTIKNYKGTIEFDAGCTLDNVVKAAGSATEEPKEEVPAVNPAGMSAAEILDAAYALEAGAAFGAPCTLTGVISTIDTEYSEQYGNITVTIIVDGNTEKPIMCFRLVGDGVAELAVGDTITVTGTIKNYNGTIEYDAKCNLDAIVKAEAPLEGASDSENTGAGELAVGEIVVGEYKGLSLTSVPQAVVDAEISTMLEYYSELVEVNRPAVEGDTVTIDFVGIKDGEAFEGGSAEDYDLILGSGSFIDGFEEGLLGASAGEEKDLNLTFPENYGNADLAGQAVVFKVTVKAVKEEVIPELTDEFVTTYFPNYTTAAEYTAAMKESLNTESYYQQITDQLMASSEVKQYDEAEVAEQKQSLIEEYKAYAAYYGSYYGLDEATSITYFLGFESIEAFEEEMGNYAYEVVKNSMIMEKIAELENLKLTDEAYATMLEEFALSYGYTETAEFVEASGGEDYIREVFLSQLVMDFIVENAVIVEAQ